MKQEDKELLIKDLCARLPYGVKAITKTNKGENVGKIISVSTKNNIILGELYNGKECFWLDYGSFKPYLRPLTSMTEREYETFPIPFSFDSFSTWNNTILSKVIEGTQILIGIDEITEIIDWLNAHHFDYRNLIEKGLALVAPEDMYQDIVL